MRRAGHDRGPYFARDADVMLRMHAVGLDRDNRAAVVGGLANLDVERYLAQKRNPAALGLGPRAAVTEDRA